MLTLVMAASFSLLPISSVMCFYFWLVWCLHAWLVASLYFVLLSNGFQALFCVLIGHIMTY